MVNMHHCTKTSGTKLFSYLTHTVEALWSLKNRVCLKPLNAFSEFMAKMLSFTPAFPNCHIAAMFDNSIKMSGYR